MKNIFRITAFLLFLSMIFYGPTSLEAAISLQDAPPLPAVPEIDSSLANTHQPVRQDTPLATTTTAFLAGSDPLSAPTAEEDQLVLAEAPCTMAMCGVTAGQTVSGIILVQPNLTLNPSIRKVAYYLNGTQSGKYYAAPFTWGGTSGYDTRTLQDGNYTLSGAYTTSTGDIGFSIAFIVNNTTQDTTPPVISAVTSTNLTSSGATITWTTHEAGDSQVQYRVHGTTPWLNTTLETPLVTSHFVVLTGLNANTLYEFQVKSKDAAGNLATQATISTFTTSAAPAGDFVGVTPGATVSGVVSIGPNLTLHPTIRKVAYYLNGTKSGKVYTSPYYWGGPLGNGTQGFDTRTITDGNYTLSMIYTDVTGDHSVAVSFVINNAVPVPALTVKSPQNNAVLPAGTVVITFVAQNVSVGGIGEPHVKFFIDADPEPYYFYNGTIDEVLYKGEHTHAVHWRDSSSFEIYGLLPGSHQVRLAAVDGNDAAYANPEAQKTVSFTVTAPPPTNFSLQSVAAGLQYPVSMVFDPAGRVFYNELLTGKIRIMDPGFSLRPDPFYQLSILTGPDRGLLGIELDPDFASNHYVYIYYAASDGANKVIRLTEANGVGTNETLILGGIPQSPTHNGGNLHFGPDGKLYISIGDMGDPSSAQNLGSLQGKMLRMNKDGSVPADNPFVGQPGARPEIWAYGLRNSFDFTFHPHTGDLWATENGPTGDDEINRIIRGGNYGWPTVTGIANNANFIDPLVVLNPSVAPTGMTALGLTGTAYPQLYQDRLFFAEYNTGAIRSIQLVGPDLTGLGGLETIYGGGLGGLLHLTLGTDGKIYASTANTIYRLEIDTTPPAISAVASSNITATGATITWTTNEASTSQVQYRVQGTTTWANTTLNPSLLTSHSVALTGLAPGTAYEYQVKSKDVAGNLATQTTISGLTTSDGGIVSEDGYFIGIRSGITLNGTIDVRLNPDAGLAVQKIFYYLDGTQAGKVYSPPFALTTTALNGTHTLSGVIAVYGVGNVPFSYTFTTDNGIRPIYMLGDSITEGTDWEAQLGRTDVINGGVPGERTDQILARMQGVYDASPQIVFMMGGLNDLRAGYSVDYAYGYYIQILEGLAAHGIRTAITSTTHVREEELSANQKVTELNTRLRDYAQAISLDFIDLDAQISENEHIKPEYTVDGVHLNAAAYDLWEAEIRAVLARYGI